MLFTNNIRLVIREGSDSQMGREISPPVTHSVETFSANEVIDENDVSRNNGGNENKKSPDPEPEGGSGKQTQAIFLLTAITVSLLF